MITVKIVYLRYEEIETDEIEGVAKVWIENGLYCVKTKAGHTYRYNIERIILTEEEK
jgi:uncharacterized protein YqfA (UPF0365 family)